METFRGKIFNEEVFETYRRKTESTKENSLIKNALFTPVSIYGAKLVGQTGGYFITEPILGRIDDRDATNYDGNTDTPKGKERETYYQTKITYGRQNSWGEYDFTSVLTGKNFMAEAGEVNEYWDDQLQKTMLSILKGISGITSNNFNTKHTYETSEKLSAGGAELAAQAVLGDKKSKLEVIFMHSKTATNLNILNLIEFMKYTDANGITRNLNIGTYNGNTVVVDDDMPIESGYDVATSTDTGALKVVADSTTTVADGEIKLSDVKAADFYPSSVKAGDYVKAGTKYISYMFKKGFFEREELSVPVRDEVVRDAYDKGGHNDLISRMREIIVPTYISWTKTDSYSPLNSDFANSTNWEIVNNNKTGADKKYVDDKLIPFVKIVSREA